MIQNIICQNNLNADFGLQDGRIMLSLGPLSKEKACAYSCPFCYVKSASFPAYNSLSINDILKWIHNQNGKYNIIYISGDTDSFASPRTEKALELLLALTDLKVDLLFTTRSVFKETHYTILNEVLLNQIKNKKLLIGCVSISQLNDSFLEPKPIPSVQERVDQLKQFHSIGLSTVLAMRPLLPIVPLQDYCKLIDITKEYVDLILGSNWFTDLDGIIESRVIKEAIHNFSFRYEKMDFYNSNATWKVYEDCNLISSIKNHCQKNNLNFYLRSQPAVNWLRDRLLT